MPNVNDLKTSKFLTKHDVDPPILVTIAKWSKEDVSMETQAEEMKFVLHFKEIDKPLVLNMTNGMLIADIAKSEDFDHWVGIQIVLFNDETVMFAGKRTGGIRVRASKMGQSNPNYVGGGQDGICPHCQKSLEDCTCNIPF